MLGGLPQAESEHLLPDSVTLYLEPSPQNCDLLRRGRPGSESSPRPPAPVPGIPVVFSVVSE